MTAQDGGKVVSLTHRPPLTQGNTPGTHFCWRLSRPQGHSATGRTMSLKNSNDTIGNRTRDLPVWQLPNTDYAHKKITSNFSQARSTLPEDGSQRVRNMSEFLSFKTLIQRRF